MSSSEPKSFSKYMQITKVINNLTNKTTQTEAQHRLNFCEERAYYITVPAVIIGITGTLAEAVKNENNCNNLWILSSTIFVTILAVNEYAHCLDETYRAVQEWQREELYGVCASNSSEEGFF